jgi:hypothetical protein
LYKGYSSVAREGSLTDSDFNTNEALKNDPTAMIEEFLYDWLSYALLREDRYALALLIVLHITAGLSTSHWTISKKI